MLFYYCKLTTLNFCLNLYHITPIDNIIIKISLKKHKLLLCLRSKAGVRSSVHFPQQHPLPVYWQSIMSSWWRAVAIMSSVANYVVVGGRCGAVRRRAPRGSRFETAWCEWGGVTCMSLSWWWRNRANYHAAPGVWSQTRAGRALE